MSTLTDLIADAHKAVSKFQAVADALGGSEDALFASIGGDVVVQAVHSLRPVLEAAAADGRAVEQTIADCMAAAEVSLRNALGLDMPATLPSPAPTAPEDPETPVDDTTVPSPAAKGKG
jgi:hypothetical protein